MLRLRWTYQGRGYSLAVGLPDTPINRAVAEAKAAKIQIDIALEQFDLSLDKYRLKAPKESVLNAELFDKFIEWKKSEGLSSFTAANRYRTIRNHLDKFGPISSVKEAERLIIQVGKRLKPKSLNQYIAVLRAFGRWAMECDHCRSDLFRTIVYRKSPRNRPLDSRTPFSRDEIARFLATIKDHHRYSHYHDFCLTLFSLGLRPSEAIGLRWCDIDFPNKTVTIAESLSRSEKGGRERKETKNGVVRRLRLSSKMLTVLSARKPPDAKDDDLVFRAQRGGVIDDHTFRERCWKQICKDAGIKYRSPYTARHTLISHGLEYEQWSVVQAAEVAGDTVRTITENYAHVIEPPSMPEF